jgi:CcmD family protein
MRKGTREKGKGKREEQRQKRGWVGSLIISVCLLAGPAIAAQPPATPDGFVPASSLPNQEQLPAAPLVIGAYSIVWLLVFGYLWSIWNRIGRVERDLADVSRRIAASQRQ